MAFKLDPRNNAFAPNEFEVDTASRLGDTGQMELAARLQEDNELIVEAEINAKAPRYKSPERELLNFFRRIESIDPLAKEVFIKLYGKEEKVDLSWPWKHSPDDDRAIAISGNGFIVTRSNSLGRGERRLNLAHAWPVDGIRSKFPKVNIRDCKAAIGRGSLEHRMKEALDIKDFTLKTIAELAEQFAAEDTQH